MTSETERAEIADRRRAKAAPFLGLLLLTANQWLFFRGEWSQNVTVWQMVLWLALVLLAFFILMTGGLWFLPKKVRVIADDEATRGSRQKAIQAGLIAAFLTSLVVFVVSPIEPISAQRASHLIISISLGLAFIVYGIEENRHRA